MWEIADSITLSWVALLEILCKLRGKLRGTLASYSRAGEILDIMQNSENPKITAAAQEETMKAIRRQRNTAIQEKSGRGEAVG